MNSVVYLEVFEETEFPTSCFLIIVLNDSLVDQYRLTCTCSYGWEGVQRLHGLLVSGNLSHRCRNKWYLAYLAPTFEVYDLLNTPKTSMLRKFRFTEYFDSVIRIFQWFNSGSNRSWMDESDSGGRTSTNEWENLWRQTAADGLSFSRSTVDKILT